MKLRAVTAFLLSSLSLSAAADVGFTSDRYSTVAGNSQVTLRVQRDSADGEITIGYRTVPGTAVPGSDYVHQAAGSVTIPAGQAGPVSISVPLIFNGNSQTRSFAVELTSTSGDVLSGFVRADVQILGSQDPANSVGIVRFPLPADTVERADLYALSISRESGSKGAASVRVVTRPGSGFDPIDQVLSWGDGQVGVKTIPVHATVPFGARAQTITVPVELTAITGFTLQGPSIANIYFLSPAEEPPVAARFTTASQVLGAATTGLDVGYSIPVDPDDEESTKGYVISVRGVTTDVLRGRDYNAEGDGPVTLDDDGSASVSVEFPTRSINDRQLELVLSRYGIELDRVLFTLLGTVNDPYFRDENSSLQFGTFAFFGSETRLNTNAVAITTQVNRTGPSPLGAATLQYRLTAEDGVSGRDTAAATDIGTLNWSEGEVGSKTIVIPLLITNQEQDRRFTMTVKKVGESTPLSTQQIVILGRGNANQNTIGFTTDLRFFPQDAETLVAFVERRGAGTGAATVNYRIEDGNTVIGLDYPVEAAVGSLDWAEGETGAKMILIDRIPRDPFRSKALTVRLTGTDVTSDTATQTILVDALPITFETAGRIQLDRREIFTDTNTGSVNVKLSRAGGTQSKVTAIVRTTFADGTTRDDELIWAIGSNQAQTLTIPVESKGEIQVEVISVNGALRSADGLTITVEAASSGGGGAFGSEVLPLAALAYWIRRRRSKLELRDA